MAATLDKFAGKASIARRSIFGEQQRDVLPDLPRESVFCDLDHPTYIHVVSWVDDSKHGTFDKVKPSLSKANKRLEAEGLLHVIERSALEGAESWYARKTAQHGWLRGCTYRRHENPASDEYFPIDGWDAAMSRAQHTAFSTLCRWGGVKSVKIITGGQYEVDDAVGVTTNVADAASLEFNSARNAKFARHSTWAMTMQQPTAHPIVASVDQYIVDRKKAARGSGGGTMACQSFMQIIGEGEARQAPTVRKVIVRLEVSRGSLHSASASAGARGVDLGAEARLEASETDTVDLFVCFWPSKEFAALRYEFKREDVFRSPQMDMLENCAEQCLLSARKDDCVNRCLHNLFNYSESLFFLIVGEAGVGKSTFIHSCARAIAGNLDPGHETNSTPLNGMFIRHPRPVAAASDRRDFEALADGTKAPRRFVLLDNLTERRGSLSIIDTRGFPAKNTFDAKASYKDFVEMGGSRAKPLMLFVAFDAAALYRMLLDGGGGEEKAKKLLTQHKAFVDEASCAAKVLLMKFDLIALAERDSATRKMRKKVKEVFGPTVGVEMVANLTLPTQRELEQFHDLVQAACIRIDREAPYRDFIKARKQKHDEVLELLNMSLLAVSERLNT